MVSGCVMSTERQPSSTSRRHDRLRRHRQSADCCWFWYWCPGQGSSLINQLQT